MQVIFIKTMGEKELLLRLRGGGKQLEYFEIHRVVTDDDVVSVVKCKNKEDAIQKYNKHFPNHVIKSCEETNSGQVIEYINSGGLVLV